MTDLVDAAVVIGGYVWVEERLFEILGQWVPAVADPEVKLRLAADSHHHAWHASLWRDRLPALREMPPERFVGPAGESAATFATALAASSTTLEKLVGAYRVALPRLVACYSHHRERASTVTDGPTIRALDLVLADDLADWRSGELLVQAALGCTADVELAAAHQARLEAVLVTGSAPS